LDQTPPLKDEQKRLDFVLSNVRSNEQRMQILGALMRKQVYNLALSFNQLDKLVSDLQSKLEVFKKN
jgi:hypothetical protein